MLCRDCDFSCVFPDFGGNISGELLIRPTAQITEWKAERSNKLLRFQVIEIICIIGVKHVDLQILLLLEIVVDQDLSEELGIEVVCNHLGLPHSGLSALFVKLPKNTECICLRFTVKVGKIFALKSKSNSLL